MRPERHSSGGESRETRTDGNGIWPAEKVAEKEAMEDKGR